MKYFILLGLFVSFSTSAKEEIDIFKYSKNPRVQAALQNTGAEFDRQQAEKKEVQEEAVEPESDEPSEVVEYSEEY